MKKLFQFGGLLATGLAVGYWLGNASLRPDASGPSTHSTAKAISGQVENLRSGKNWQKFRGNTKELLDRALEIPRQRDTTYFLYRALEELPAEELPAYAKQLVNLSEGTPFRATALREIQRLWAEDDSTAAQAWPASLPITQRVVAMQHLIENMAETNPSQAMKLAETLGTQEDRLAAKLQIAITLSHTNPKAAWDMVLSNEPVLKAPLLEILSNWAHVDVKTAFAAAEKLPHHLRDAGISTVLEVWIETNPAEGLHAASKLEGDSIRPEIQAQALSNWSKADPDAAISWFKSLPPGQQNSIDASKLFYNLAKKDPMTAVEMLKIIRGHHRRENLNSVVSAWAVRDVNAAIRWIKTLDGDDLAVAFNSLGTACQVADTKQIASILEDISDVLVKRAFLEGCFADDVTSDPARLGEILRKIPLTEAQFILHATPMIQSASMVNCLATQKLLVELQIPASDELWEKINFTDITEPTATVAWIESLPTEYQKRLLPNALISMAGVDGAIAFKKALAIQRDGDNVLPSIIAAWAESAPETLSQFLPELSDKLQDKAANAIITQMAETDSVSAAAYLLKSQGDSAVNQHVIPSAAQTLGHEWGKSDPEAAVAWLPNLTSPESKESFILGLAHTWIDSEPMKAGDWINSLAPSETKDIALNLLIDALREDNPAAALRWAEQIQNKFERTNTYRSTLINLIEIDPVAGKRALETSPLSKAEKKSILEEIDN